MTAPPYDFFADLGNWGWKLAAPGLQKVATFGWRNPAEQQRFEEEVAGLSPARLLLACSSEQGWASIQRWLPSSWQVDFASVPEEVQVLSTGTGMDRVLASYEAWQHYGGAVVVADCGTAFTVDVMDAQGRFHGGAIGPGLGLQQSALATACPHLAAAEEAVNHGIPSHTAAAVAAGTRRALAHAVAALAQEFVSTLGPATLVLSGGDAAQLAPFLPDWDRQEHLVLRALQRMAQRSGA